MNIVSPYRNIKQYTRISVEPYQMNSDIRNNMKLILKKKVEKKCNKNGFVDEVFRIIDYSDGMMPAENLGGSAIYNITYHCKLCIPIENTAIVGLVKVINQELVVATNGPIMFFIPKENVDNNIWDIPDGYMNKTTSKKLLVGDYIKIQIIDKRINQNDNQIKAIGRLVDFASSEDVEIYFGSKVVSDKGVDNTLLVSHAKHDNNTLLASCAKHDNNTLLASCAKHDNNTSTAINSVNTEEPDIESNYIM
jgi:DNA-directed RNA polymerase subunit E'/Rpb7